MSTATLLSKLKDLNRRIKSGELDRPPKRFKRCACGNLIVLAHGEKECAVCYMKRMGLWKDEPWEKPRTTLDCVAVEGAKSEAEVKR